MPVRVTKRERSPCWAVIVAAGRGQRMGADRPKQYLSVLGRTIIEHTLDRVFQVSAIDGIVVTIAENDCCWQHLNLPAQKPLVTVTDSNGRCHSVLTALTYLRQHEGLPGDAQILVHDGVRPCVRVVEFESLIECTRVHPVGGLLVAPNDLNVALKKPKSPCEPHKIRLTRHQGR